MSVLIGNHQLIGTAEKRRASVPIDSQLIGGRKAQITLVGLMHGSRTTYGSEVIFTDPHNGIHGDANNVGS